MHFVDKGGVRFLAFDSFAEKGVVHGIFTRRGGASTAPWASLNMGSTVGDQPAAVAHNRRLAFEALERSPTSLYDVWQVHGTDVVSATAPRLPHSPHIKADILLTDRPEVTLVMRFADCVPILLYDPRRRVVGLVHAGWQGTVKRAAAAAAAALRARYHSDPADLIAGIGPSIAVHHYPVGEDVAKKVQAAFGEAAGALLPQVNGAVQFDLWAANRLVLEEAGVRQIETAGICTACHLEDWYSHRGERGRTGRFGALIGLKGD